MSLCIAEAEEMKRVRFSKIPTPTQTICWVIWRYQSITASFVRRETVAESRYDIVLLCFDTLTPSNYEELGAYRPPSLGAELHGRLWSLWHRSHLLVVVDTWLDISLRTINVRVGAWPCEETIAWWGGNCVERDSVNILSQILINHFITNTQNSFAPQQLLWLSCYTILPLIRAFPRANICITVRSGLLYSYSHCSFKYDVG